KTAIEAGGSRLAALHAKDGHDCLEHSSHCLHKGSGCTGGAALCCDAACHAMQQMAYAAAIGGPLPLRRGIRLATRRSTATRPLFTIVHQSPERIADVSSANG